jgi:hypothetical protein
MFDRPVLHYITLINNTARTSSFTAHPHYNVYPSHDSRLQHIASHFALFEILSAAVSKNQIFHAEITDKHGALFASANFFGLLVIFQEAIPLRTYPLSQTALAYSCSPPANASVLNIEVQYILKLSAYASCLTRASTLIKELNKLNFVYLNQ